MKSNQIKISTQLKYLLSITTFICCSVSINTMAQNIDDNSRNNDTNSKVEVNNNNLSANISAVSQYRFRGLAQTWGKPAIQASVDYNNTENGIYTGVWASNISKNNYPTSNNTNIEIDYYAGYNGKITDKLTWNAGGYGYYYPNANYNKSTTSVYQSQSFNNFELNAGLGYEYLSYKLSIAMTDYFGANTKTGFTKSTKGTMYHDINFNYPLRENLTLNLHVGYTDYKGKYILNNQEVNPDYLDMKFGLTYNLPNKWTTSLAYIKASNNNKGLYKQYSSLSKAESYNLNKSSIILTATKSF